MSTYHDLLFHVLRSASDAQGALKQAALLLGALLFLAIGGVLLGYSRYWRRHA